MRIIHRKGDQLSRNSSDYAERVSQNLRGHGLDTRLRDQFLRSLRGLNAATSVVF
jgi:hypothetical protein